MNCYTYTRSILLFIACIITQNVYAKDNIHIFKKATEAYVPLSGTVPVTGAVMAYDSVLISSLAGETFNLLGKPRTLAAHSIMIKRDGRIWFSEDTAFAVIDVLNCSLLESIDASSSVSYKIEGTGTGKVLKVEWKNLRVKSGQAGNFVNVQTWIYQQSGIVEFRYGPRSANNASGYTDPATGLYIGISYCNNSVTNMYEKMQVTGTPPNYNVDSVLNLNVPNIQGVPDEGTVFRYVPKAVAAGVDDLSLFDNVIAYPNPSNDKLVVKLPETSNTTIEMVQMSGRLVYRGSSAGNSHIIDTRNIPAGSYILHVEGGGYRVNRNVQIIH